MSDPMEWQTEEEGNWPDDSQVDPPAISGRRWRRSLLIFIPLIVLVVGAVYWQAREQVEEATAARESDILSSYRLIRDAAEKEDVEVMTTLLSGVDLNWARAQQDLAEKGWLYDRHAFGLRRVSGSVNVVGFSFSPELNSAELTTEEDYLLNAGAETIQKVTLRRVDVFRTGSRWLWAPPKNDFWGGAALARSTGEYVTVFYPRRDEDIVGKLLIDLEDSLAQLCQRSDLCPEIRGIQIRFSHDPAEFIALQENYLQFGFQGELVHLPDGRLSITLPTPSLVGLPVDDSGYEAISKGYGRLIVGAMIDDFLERDCCGDSKMRQATIRSSLHGIGLWPWTNVTSTSPTMAAGHDYDLVTLCVTAPGPAASLWRYNTVQQSWRSVSTKRPILAIEPLPEGKGIAILETSNQNGLIRTRILLWRNGIELTIFDELLSSAEINRFRWQVRERENRLIIELPDVNIGLINLIVFDLDQCDQLSCIGEEIQTVLLPTWSPDGSKRLAHQQGMIWRNEGVFSVPIAQGERPFWITDTAFGYLIPIGEETAIAYKMSSGVSAEIVLTTEELRNLLPDEYTGDKLVIGHVAVDPRRPDSWVILGLSLGLERETEHAVLFQFDLATRKIEMLEIGPNLRSFDLAGAGNRLATSRYDVEGQSWRLSIYSLNDDFEQFTSLAAGDIIASPPSYRWSPDGEWLSVLHEGVQSFFHPQDRIDYSFNTPAPGCVQSTWVVRN